MSKVAMVFIATFQVCICVCVCVCACEEGGAERKVYMSSF